MVHRLTCEQVVRRKLECIARHKELASFVSPARCFDSDGCSAGVALVHTVDMRVAGVCGLHSAQYNIWSADIRRVEAVEAAVVGAGIDFECVGIVRDAYTITIAISSQRADDVPLRMCPRLHGA